MFVATASLDGSEGLGNPTWRQVEALVRRLDGARHSDLLLSGEDDSFYMAICGGNERRFMVVVQRGDLGCFRLVREAATSELQMVVVGRLESYQPASMCLELKTVLRAVKYYLRSGELDPSLGWKKGWPAEETRRNEDAAKEKPKRSKKRKSQ